MFATISEGSLDSGWGSGQRLISLNVLDELFVDESFVLGQLKSDLGDMRSFLGDLLLLLDLPHQTVKVLMHLVLMMYLVLALGGLESLDVGMDFFSQLILLHLFLLLPLLLSLDLPIEEGLSLHLLLLPLLGLQPDRKSVV